MTAYKSVDIYNCNADLRSINIWVLDHDADTDWEPLGSLAPQFDDSAFCPAENLKPISKTLADGHVYDIVCIDMGLNECLPPRNDPTNVNCIRRALKGIIGKDDGTKLTIKVL